MMIMLSILLQRATILQVIAIMVLSFFHGQGIAAPAADSVQMKTKDPHFGEALLYFYRQDYLSSLAHLTAFDKLQQLPTQKEDSDLLLGILQFSYGLTNAAQESFKKVLSNKKYTQRTRDTAALYLAKIHYNQGGLSETDIILDAMGDALPAPLRNEKDFLQLNVLIDRNRWQAAEKALLKLDGERETGSLRWYGQHNLGVAMLRNDQFRQGIGILGKISAEPVNDIERRILQDKANLALGYAYLQASDMNTAISYFQKVRIKSPFSSQALLGLGLSEAALGQHQRALIPWLELQKGDIREPEVQEAVLLIPEALFKLESYKNAQGSYQNAVSRYQAEINAVTAATEAVRAGSMATSVLSSRAFNKSDVNDFIGKLPLVPEARYFPWFMRDTAFRQAISLYREALDLRNTMVSQKDTLNSYGLSSNVTIRYAEKINEQILEIDSTLNKLAGYIQKSSINWLENKKADLNVYLSQANLGLAKVYHHVAERVDP